MDVIVNLLVGHLSGGGVPHKLRRLVLKAFLLLRRVVKVPQLLHVFELGVPLALVVESKRHRLVLSVEHVLLLCALQLNLDEFVLVFVVRAEVAQRAFQDCLVSVLLFLVSHEGFEGVARTLGEGLLH